jgi:hypothetical protein
VLDRPIKRAADVLFERVGDDTAVLDLATGTYTRLNSTGSALWERLADPTTVADLGAHLAREFDLAPAVARADADRFVVMLRERGLLEAG